MPKRYNYLVGLDLGSYATRCVVAIEEHSRLRFISAGSAPSRGWARGVIADQDPVVNSLEKAIEEAEKNGGMIVEAAVVGVGGSHIKSNVCHSYVNLAAESDPARACRNACKGCWPGTAERRPDRSPGNSAGIHR